MLTVSIFGERLSNAALPADGSVIRILNSRQRELWEGKYPQLIARVGDISVVEADA